MNNLLEFFNKKKVPTATLSKVDVVYTTDEFHSGVLPLIISTYAEYGWRGDEGSLGLHETETRRALESWDNLYEAVDLLEGRAHAAGKKEAAPSERAAQKKEFGKRLKWGNIGNMKML